MVFLKGKHTSLSVWITTFLLNHSPQSSYLWCALGVTHLWKGLHFQWFLVMCFVLSLLAFLFVCGFFSLCWSQFYKQVPILTFCWRSTIYSFSLLFLITTMIPLWLGFSFLQSRKFFTDIHSECRQNISIYLGWTGDSILVLTIIFWEESVSEVVSPCYW